MWQVSSLSLNAADQIESFAFDSDRNALCFCPLVLHGQLAHQQQRWPQSHTERKGERQRRDILEGDQRRHGLDQPGTGEGQRLRDHQLHYPEVLSYSRDQDCQSAAGAEILAWTSSSRPLYANQQTFLFQQTHQSPNKLPPPHPQNEKNCCLGRVVVGWGYLKSGSVRQKKNFHSFWLLLMSEKKVHKRPWLSSLLRVLVIAAVFPKK